MHQAKGLHKQRTRFEQTNQAGFSSQPCMLEVSETFWESRPMFEDNDVFSSLGRFNPQFGLLRRLAVVESSFISGS